MHNGRFVLALIVAALVSPGTGRPAAQAPVPVTEFWFDTGRPMARAAEELEKQFGWMITYEDPPYEFLSDIQDVTVLVRKDGALSPKVLVPNGVPFAFSVARASAAPTGVLSALVEAYAVAGNPGRFRVIGELPMFHLVPTETRDTQGRPTPRTAVLDASISLPSGRRSLFSVVAEIATEVTKTTGVTVFPGMMPLNLMIQTQVEIAAAMVPARVLLRQVLLESGKSLSWRLFYSPSEHTYALNIHPVVRSEPVSAQ